MMRQIAGITRHQDGQTNSLAHGRTTTTRWSLTTSAAVQRSTVEIVQEVWAEVLNLAGVAPDDDFVDLGGNSLMVASTIERLSSRVGLEIPLRALFEAPTPAEMAELIEELRAAQRAAAFAGPVDGVTPFFPPWLVPLQREGHERPIFLIPGGKGGVWTLKRDAQIAAVVGRRHPFYGFRRDKFHLDRERADWISTTAAEYVAQMRTVQGRGPFLIYAICAGGALAWETARQLVACREKIAGMLFYEVPCRIERTAEGQIRIASWRDNVERQPTYVAEPLGVDLTLLMTEAWQAAGRSDGWRHVTRGDVETVVMPGDTPGAHNIYVGRERMIAEHVRDWIDRSESRLRPS